MKERRQVPAKDQSRREQQSSPRHASRPSLMRNETIANDVTASTHHAPRSRSAIRPTTTTSDSQPQVMLSTASARMARLPSCVAIAILRRASAVMRRRQRRDDQSRQEKLSPWRVHRLQAAPAIMYAARRTADRRRFCSQAARIVPKRPVQVATRAFRRQISTPAEERQFNQTVETEGRERQTSGGNARADRDGALGEHPCDRQPFQAEGLSD